MLAEAIAQALHDAGVGVYSPSSVGGTIYIVYMPPTPDEVIVITPTGGQTPGVKLPYDAPTFQIRVRGTRDPRTGFETAMEAYNVLQSIHQDQLPNGERVSAIQALQSAPVSIGADESGRIEFTQNYVALGHVNVTAQRS